MDESPTGRKTVLLIGDSYSTARLHAALIALDFADVERRVLNDMVVHGRGFSRMIIDEAGMLEKQYVSPRSVYNNWKQEAADSLDRRKEPKGPRGRWGKL